MVSHTGYNFQFCFDHSFVDGTIIKAVIQSKLFKHHYKEMLGGIINRNTIIIMCIFGIPPHALYWNWNWRCTKLKLRCWLQTSENYLRLQTNFCFYSNRLFPNLLLLLSITERKCPFKFKSRNNREMYKLLMDHFRNEKF